MKSDKAKNLSKESSTVQDRSLSKRPAGNSTRKDKDLATVTTNDREPITTNQGQLISTDQNSLRVGHRGPTLMEDQVLREKIQHFDHERIPERVVHARGAAAHGIFQVYDDSLLKYTTAKVLTDPGLTTPVFVRFSTVTLKTLDNAKSSRYAKVRHFLRACSDKPTRIAFRFIPGESDFVD